MLRTNAELVKFLNFLKTESDMINFPLVEYKVDGSSVIESRVQI